MLLYIIISILVLIIISLLILFYMFFKRTDAKFDIYETYISGTYENIIRAYNIMRTVDIRGAFESDDEVGEVFRIIKFEIDRLKNIVDSSSESETTEKNNQ